MKVYDALILKAKLREKLEGYVEKHHIIPVALGGSNAKWNLVLLTAREHYIAHLLLFKHYRIFGTPKEKSSTAYTMLYFLSSSKKNTPNRTYIVPGHSKVYDSVREAISKARKGKSHLEIFSKEGLENLLKGHANRRKYTNTFEWVNGSNHCTATVYALAEKFNIPVSGLIKVAYKGGKISYGWSIKGVDTSRKVKALEKLVTLTNIKTGIQIKEEVSFFVKTYGLRASRVNELLAKKCNISKDWCLPENYDKYKKE